MVVVTLFFRISHKKFCMQPCVYAITRTYVPMATYMPLRMHSSYVQRVGDGKSGSSIFDHQLYLTTRQVQIFRW